MTHLWDAHCWEQHKSEFRWLPMILRWPQSSILRAIRVPFLAIVLTTVLVILLNRVLASYAIPRMTLPLAPLSLQASSIGLLLVFRNNQTHDRLKEAQRALGGLGALAREVMQLLIVHVPAENSRDVGLAARLLALFGWLLKSQCRGEEEEVGAVAETLLPRAHRWLLNQQDRPAAALLRLRAVIGALRKSGALSGDAFKFIEERLAKISTVDSTVHRLATFPVPPSYHRHGSRAILLWLGSLPFVLEGLSTPPLQTLMCVAATSWLLLGIDQIAIEVEQPLDVLPLHLFASGMSTDVVTVLESWASMPLLPLADDDAPPPPELRRSISGSTDSPKVRSSPGATTTSPKRPSTSGRQESAAFSGSIGGGLGLWGNSSGPRSSAGDKDKHA